MTDPSAPEVGSGTAGDRVAADATAVDHIGEMTVLVVDNYDSDRKSVV